MAERNKKKPYGKAAMFGICSVAAYVVLFENRTLVMDYFTRGGAYAVFPIVTAFFFSFIHGAFASNVLNVLGIHAAKK